jgi:hypothetical protein
MSKQKIQKFSAGELIRYASHEAGHAVVGHVIGRLIEEVSILPDRERGYKGYCRFSDFMESANDHLEWQRGSANPEIMTILYAGTVAMEIVCGRHGWKYELWRGCDQADLDAIDEWCLEILIDDDQRAAVKATCLAQARDLLSGHWDAVDALATELVVYGRLTGGGAHRVIRQALGETGPDWRLATWNIKE